MSEEKNIADAVQGEWHKIAMLIMQKHGTDHEVITPEDIGAIPEGTTIVIREMSDGLHVQITDERTALEMQRLFQEAKKGGA